MAEKDKENEGEVKDSPSLHTVATWIEHHESFSCPRRVLEGAKVHRKWTSDQEVSREDFTKAIKDFLGSKA